jgi:dethiobiotin synthetase
LAAYFITGTGTDIGKTWLCAALLSYWRTQGLTTQAIKPVMSGVDPAALEASDAGALLLAQGLPVNAQTVAAIAPWRFAAPLSPDMAAALEGRAIDFDELVAFSCRATSADFYTLIEGVGGVMAPLDAKHTVLDWIVAVAAPTILVAGSYLGSMSHTLTALKTLSSAGAAIAAIVVNESVGSTVELIATVDSLRHHAAGVPVLAVHRVSAAADVAALARLLDDRLYSATSLRSSPSRP